MVHYGIAETVRDHRTTVLAAAYAAHPERFVRGVPQPAPLPTAVWINPPATPHPAREDARTPTAAPALLRVHPMPSPILFTEAVQ